MAKVKCTVSGEPVYGDYGYAEGMIATCQKCGHTTESLGTTEASVRRCLALMREECPNKESNFYVEE